MSDVVSRLQDNLAVARGKKKIVDFERNSSLKGLRYLNPLYNHIARRETIKIEYQSFSARRPFAYTVFPHLLKEYRNRWFLFCTNTKGTLYNFALDRILAIQTEPGIPYKDNPDFDPDTYFEDLIGVTKWGNPTEITFWASREQALYIATKPIHPSQQIIQDKTKDGSKTFSVKVEPNWEFFSLMLGFGPGVRILSPNSVVREMKRKIKKAAELYTEPLKDSEDLKTEEE
jgi:predicted DNA-binding transcriptional regulator YafY